MTFTVLHTLEEVSTKRVPILLQESCNCILDLPKGSEMLTAKKNTLTGRNQKVRYCSNLLRVKPEQKQSLTRLFIKLSGKDKALSVTLDI